MALVNAFEKEGNFLFRHRGEIPIVLFIAAIPIIYYTNYSNISNETSVFASWLAFTLSFIGLIYRSIAIATTPKGTSGRNTKEGQVAESLNTSGIYSTVRHPLYVGNYFMWIGIVVYTFNIPFIIIVTLAFWLYYERIMYAEERFLERKFGDSYMNWANKTPAFIPSYKRHTKNVVPFSFVSVLRREYSGVLATVFSFVFIGDLRIYFAGGDFNLNSTGHYILLGTAVLALILRSLKHYTSVLKEDGRS